MNAPNEEIYNITQIALDKGRIGDVLELFSGYCHSATAFLKTSNKDFYITAAPNDFTENIRLYPIDEILRIYMHYPVTQCGELIGSIVVNLAPNVFFTHSHLLPHLANAILICLAIIRPETISHISEDSIIPALLEGDSENLEACRNWLRRHGFDPDGKYRAVIIYTDSAAKFANRFYGIAKCFPIQFISYTRENVIFFNFCENNENIIIPILNNFNEIARHEHVHCPAKEIYIGIGSKGDNLQHFVVSSRQAASAIKYSKLFTGHTISSWDEMGITQNYTEIADIKIIKDRCFAMTEALLEHDRQNYSSLFPTLSALVLNYWNLTKTAQALFLHYNSIKYRYMKISEILSLDLDKEKTRFELSLCVLTRLFDLNIKDFGSGGIISQSILGEKYLPS